MGKAGGGQRMTRVLCVAFAVLAFAAVGSANEDIVTMLEDSDVLAMLDEEIMPKTTAEVDHEKAKTVDQLKKQMKDTQKAMEAKINEVNTKATKDKTVIIKNAEKEHEAQKAKVATAKKEAEKEVAAAKKKTDEDMKKATEDEKKIVN